MVTEGLLAEVCGGPLRAPVPSPRRGARTADRRHLRGSSRAPHAPQGDL